MAHISHRTVLRLKSARAQKLLTQFVTSVQRLAGIAASKVAGRAGSVLDFRHRGRRALMERLAEIARGKVSGRTRIRPLDALSAVRLRRRAESQK